MKGKRRAMAVALASMLPLVGYLILRARHLPEVPLSTSQWLALGTSLASAATWRHLDAAARIAGSPC